MSEVKVLTPMSKYRALFDRLKAAVEKRDPNSGVVVLQRRKARSAPYGCGGVGARAIEIDYLLLWTGVQKLVADGKGEQRRTFGFGINYLPTTASRGWSWTTKAGGAEKAKPRGWDASDDFEQKRKGENTPLTLMKGDLEDLGEKLKMLVRALEDDALLPGKGALEVVLHLCKEASGGSVKSLGDVIDREKVARENRKVDVVKEVEDMHRKYRKALGRLRAKKAQAWALVPEGLQHARESLLAQERQLLTQLEALRKERQEVEKSDGRMTAYVRKYGDERQEKDARLAVFVEYSNRLKQLTNECVRLGAVLPDKDGWTLERPQDVKLTAEDLKD